NSRAGAYEVPVTVATRPGVLAVPKYTLYDVAPGDAVHSNVGSAVVVDPLPGLRVAGALGAATAPPPPSSFNFVPSWSRTDSSRFEAFVQLCQFGPTLRDSCSAQSPNPLLFSSVM